MSFLFLILNNVFPSIGSVCLGSDTLAIFFLDIWGAETSMKKAFTALGWTALFLIGLFFADREKED